MEGLLRLTQLKPLPFLGEGAGAHPAGENNDIFKLFKKKYIKERTLKAWLTLSTSKMARKKLRFLERRSSDWGAPQTRPMEVELDVLLQLVKVACDTVDGVTKKFQI